MRSRVACLALVLSVLSSAAQAQSVTLDTNSAVTYVAAGSTLTVNYTVGSCTNCAMVVAVFYSDTGRSSTTVVWNTSQNLTNLCAVASTSQAGELWFLTAPTTGSHNLVVTPDGFADAVVLLASFSGVDQVTAHGTRVCDVYATSGTTSTHNTVGTTNGLIFDAFSIGPSDPGTVTVTSGQTTLAGPTGTADAQYSVMSTKPGGALVATGYAWVNDFIRWSQLSVGLNPVSSSSTPCLMTLLGVGKCG